MRDELEAARRSVLAWCDLYTRGLPADAAAARREELDADLLGEVEWSRRRGVAPRVAARRIRWRAARGAIDDLAWRRVARQGSSRRTAALLGDHLLLTTSLAGGSAVLLVSFLTLLRTMTPYYFWAFVWSVVVPSEAPVVATGLAALCGMILLLRRRTRVIGALWLLSAAEALILVVAPLLSRASVTFAAVSGGAAWPVATAVVAVMAAVFYAGVCARWAGAAVRGTRAPVRR